MVPFLPSNENEDNSVLGSSLSEVKNLQTKGIYLAIKQVPSLFCTNAKDSLGKLISDLESFSVSNFYFNKSKNHQTQKGFHQDDPAY